MIRLLILCIALFSPILSFAKQESIGWVEAPFIRLEQYNEKGITEFNFSLNKFRYTQTSKQPIVFEQDEIPILFKGTKDGYIAFTRIFPSGKNKIFHIDSKGVHHKANMPSFLDEFIFMNAEILHDRVVALYYNVMTTRYNIITFNINGHNITWEPGFIKEIDFGDKHISNHSISIKALKAKDRAYGYDIVQFVSGNKIVNFHDVPYVFISEDKLSDSLEFYTIRKQADTNIVILKQADSNNFEAIRSDTLKKASYKDVFNTDLKTASQVSKYLEDTISNFGASGTVNLGMNNFEGLHSWSQIYYLNGLINLEQLIKKSDAPLASKIKDRLDIEMHFVNRLMMLREYNLYTKRYSLDRKKIRSAIHLARTVRVMRRYLELSDNPITLSSYQSLVNELVDLNKSNYMDEVVLNAVNQDGVKNGTCFLRIRKGVPFPHDGINCPHNYQTQYAGELSYHLQSGNFEQNKAIVKSVYSILLDNESQYGSMPKDYKWQYTWGKAKTGRTDADNISNNTPSYPKNQYIADISYRTIDSMGIMAIARHLNFDNKNSLFEYLLKGVKEVALWPFVAEELELYDKNTTDAALLESKALDAFLMPSAGYELQNMSIALRKKLMEIK